MTDYNSIPGQDIGRATKTNAAFCNFEEWRIHLPEDLQNRSLAAWLKKSRDGHWAMYFRVGGQRSEAYFKKSDIYAWFKLTFGAVRPDCVASLKAAGFEGAKLKGLMK
jgi:hypothetical protein